MALRTVGVKLAAEIREYTTKMSQASKDAKGLGDRLGEASKSGDQLAAAAADAGKSAVAAFGLSEAAAAKLDDQIEETAREVQRLDREFRRTGDLKLFDQLGQQMAKLKKQLQVKELFTPKSLADVGADMAGEVSVSFMARLGPLIASAPIKGVHPAVVAIGAPLAGGAAALVGGAVAGAVVGAAGAGGVVGGLVLASKDAQVREAGSALGEDLGEMLGRSSAVFVPATLRGIDLIRARSLGLEPQLRRVFAAASRLVEPLVDGAFRGAENLIPGVLRAIENAGPVIDAISDGIAALGDATGDVFSDLADNADEGATALRAMFSIIEFGVRAVGGTVEFLTELFGLLDKIALISSRNFDGLTNRINQTAKAGESTDDLVERFRNLGIETRTTAEQVDALKTAFDELFGVQMTADEALIEYHQGLQDLNEELGKGAKTLSVNSEEGRKNRSAVLDQIEVIKKIRDSRIAEGMSIEEADEKYGAHLESMRKSMLQTGYSKAEVDELIGSYKAIPKKVATTVTANTTPAMTAAVKLRQYLKNIPDEVVNIAMRVTGQRNASAAASAIRKQYANRWGNIHHAETGLLNQAAAWGAGDTMYAFREPATGGEAFIPKNGDMDRSRAIWEYVGENWLGVRPAQPVVAAAGAQRMQLDVRLVTGQGAGPMQELVRAMMPHLRVEVVNRYGGRVDKALVTG